MKKEEITDAFRAIIPKLDKIPLPDAITARLLAAIGEGCSADELKEIIGSDPAITLQVLKVSNSAYYGQRSQIQNLDRAILLMGIEEIRNICLSLCLIAKFNPAQKYADKFDLEWFWKHSLVTAIIASRIAKGRQWIAREDAFIMGLLHDIGKIIFAVALPRIFDKLASVAGTANGQAFHEIEKKAGLSHTLIGSWIATRWGLPPILKYAIEFHHEPEGAIDDFSGHVALIHISDVIAHSLMPDDSQEEDDIPFPVPEALDKLNINIESWPEMQKNFENTLDDAESMLTVFRK